MVNGYVTRRISGKSDASTKFWSLVHVPDRIRVSFTQLS